MRPDSPTEPARLHAYVRGRVQAVGFREFTRRHAAALGLSGWVGNLPDGRVELVAEGPPVALHALLRHLCDGPRLGRVDDVVVEWSVPSGEWPWFEVR